jgi:hypothetical protein
MSNIPYPYTVDSATLPPLSLKHPVWHELIDESIKTLLRLRNELADSTLSNDQKARIVKGHLLNLGGYDE